MKKEEQKKADREARFTLPREIEREQLQEVAESLLASLKEAAPDGVLVLDVSNSSTEDTVLFRLAAGLFNSNSLLKAGVTLEPESAKSEIPWSLFGDLWRSNID